MKKFIGLLVTLALILTACSTDSESAKPENTQSTVTPTTLTVPVSTENIDLLKNIDITKSPFEKGYYDYKGTINNNLQIQMSIYQLKSEVVGTYFYDSQRIELRLQGKAGEDNILLYEYDESGNNTGLFKGTFKTVDKIEGTWTSADGSKNYPFVLRLSTSLPNAEYGKRYGITLSTKIDDDVNKFVDQLKDYIINGERENIAELISYPIKVNIYGHPTKIKSEEEFVKNYDRIFNSSFKDAIKNAYTRYLFANWQGIMFGESSYNIWINEIDSKLKIIGINNLK